MQTCLNPFGLYSLERERDGERESRADGWEYRTSCCRESKSFLQCVLYALVSRSLLHIRTAKIDWEPAEIYTRMRSLSYKMFKCKTSYVLWPRTTTTTTTLDLFLQNPPFPFIQSIVVRWSWSSAEPDPQLLSVHHFPQKISEGKSKGKSVKSLTNLELWKLNLIQFRSEQNTITIRDK